MTRKDPPSPPPQLDLEKARPSGMVEITRSYRLITPLLGGGVETRTLDPVTPIHGSTIRGQLRFWWRALRGGSPAGTSDAECLSSMRQREGEIWGWAAGDGAAASNDKDKESKASISKVRPVQLFVTVLKHGSVHVPQLVQPYQKASRTHSASVPAYAGFPIQTNPTEIKVHVEWTLTLWFHPDHRTDVAAALWAWETFGGIGGRTRRGFGAFERTDEKASLPASVDSIRSKLSDYIHGEVWAEGVPHLNAAFIKIIYPDTPHQSTWKHPYEPWHELISVLQKFRQKRQSGPNKHPGRSKWPEPDAIRHIWLKHFPRWKLAHEPQHNDYVFPRAAFGLPIVFHFKDTLDPGENVDGRKKDITLQGMNDGINAVERWASPLILRSLPMVNGYAGIAVLLENSNDSQIETPIKIKIPPLKLVSFSKELDSGMSTDLQKAAIRTLIGSTSHSALQAFFDSL